MLLEVALAAARAAAAAEEEEEVVDGTADDADIDAASLAAPLAAIDDKERSDMAIDVGASICALCSVPGILDWRSMDFFATEFRENAQRGADCECRR